MAVVSHISYAHPAGYTGNMGVTYPDAGMWQIFLLHARITA